MDRESQHIQAVKGVLLEESFSPSVELVNFLATRVRSSIPTQQFAPIVKEAFDQFINDRIDDRLRVTSHHRQLSDAAGTSAHHTSSDREFEGYFVVNVT